MRNIGLRLALVASLILSLLIGLRLQPWSILTVANAGDAALEFSASIDGRPVVTGELKPGGRLRGIYRLTAGEADVAWTCTRQQDATRGGNAGYLEDYGPHLTTLTVQACGDIDYRDWMMPPP